MLQWLRRRIYSELTMPKTPSAGKSEKCAWVAKLLDRGVEPNWINRRQDSGRTLGGRMGPGGVLQLPALAQPPAHRRYACSQTLLKQIELFVILKYIKESGEIEHQM